MSDEPYTEADVEACVQAASAGYSGLAAVHWRIAALPVVRDTLNTMADQGRLLPPPAEPAVRRPAGEVSLCGHGEYRLSHASGPLLPGEYWIRPSGRLLVCCAGCGHLFSEVENLDCLPRHQPYLPPAQ